MISIVKIGFEPFPILIFSRHFIIILIILSLANELKEEGFLVMD